MKKKSPGKGRARKAVKKSGIRDLSPLERGTRRVKGGKRLGQRTKRF